MNWNGLFSWYWKTKINNHIWCENTQSVSIFLLLVWSTLFWSYQIILYPFQTKHCWYLVWLWYLLLVKNWRISNWAQIEYEGFLLLNNPQGLINRGVLKFSFTDGDGDIGLAQGDTIPPHDYNLYIDYFEKQNGEYVKIEFVDFSFNARIPNINTWWEQ